MSAITGGFIVDANFTGTLDVLDFKELGFVLAAAYLKAHGRDAEVPSIKNRYQLGTINGIVALATKFDEIGTKKRSQATERKRRQRSREDGTDLSRDVTQCHAGQCVTGCDTNSGHAMSRSNKQTNKQTNEQNERTLTRASAREAAAATDELPDEGEVANVVKSVSPICRPVLDNPPSLDTLRDWVANHWAPPHPPEAFLAYYHEQMSRRGWNDDRGRPLLGTGWRTSLQRWWEVEQKKFGAPLSARDGSAGGAAPSANVNSSCCRQPGQTYEDMIS